jgi:hypothetical protein
MRQTRWEGRAIKLFLGFIALILCLFIGWRLLFTERPIPDLIKRSKNIVDAHSEAKKMAKVNFNDKWNITHKDS